MLPCVMLMSGCALLPTRTIEVRPIAPPMALYPCILPEYDAKTNADIVEYVVRLQSEIIGCEAKRSALVDTIAGKE